MTLNVVSWWTFLCAVAVLNVTAWSVAAHSIRRNQSSMPVQAYAACRIQLALSAAYVFGCAFRSVLPVYDIPRLCLFDTWLSDVIVGRSVATFAELCFVAQWAFMLNIAGRAAGSLFAMTVSLLLVPLIATAEACSWYAVLTTSNLGHVAENSLWAVSVVLLTASMIAILPRYPGPRRWILIVWSAAGVAYVAFMFLVDVPTYWARYLADEAHGRHYMTIAQGLADAASRRVVSYRWADWKSEVVWMSLYFSIAVWLSISMMHARAAIAFARGPSAPPRPAQTSLYT